MPASTPGPAVDLIDHAAGIIVKKQKEPHTAPYHWAGALWEAGMLVAPGAVPAESAQVTELKVQLSAARFVAAERERELLELKGPCTNTYCPLHCAHAGPCATRPDDQ